MMKPKTLLASLLALFFSAAAFAAPAQVILIRHAEKPEYGSELSPEGRKRAEALVWFFQTNTSVTRYGTPAAIYAAAPKHEDSSLRSIQTVTPLANALKMEINTGFTRGQTHKIAADIMENPAYRGRMVLVCWQHTNLVDIVHELAAYSNTAQAVLDTLPTAWPDGAFDRVWILDFHYGRVAAFRDIPQNLLPGDSTK
ncbi:MAG: histidine phosphatase family protein [Elusimicrobia bacterium]|nr:histidine phosphatase family protein [Elusimicrobiota bacterium]